MQLPAFITTVLFYPFSKACYRLSGFDFLSIGLGSDIRRSAVEWGGWGEKLQRLFPLKDYKRVHAMPLRWIARRQTVCFNQIMRSRLFAQT